MRSEEAVLPACGLTRPWRIARLAYGVEGASRGGGKGRSAPESGSRARWQALASSRQFALAGPSRRPPLNLPIPWQGHDDYGFGRLCRPLKNIQAEPVLVEGIDIRLEVMNDGVPGRRGLDIQQIARKRAEVLTITCHSVEGAINRGLNLLHLVNQVGQGIPRMRDAPQRRHSLTKDAVLTSGSSERPIEYSRP